MNGTTTATVLAQAMVPHILKINFRPRFARR
jgi:hypothetical protein